MNTTEESNLEEQLVTHLHQLLNKHIDIHKQWCLVDEIPEHFLTNGVLELNDIDFSLLAHYIQDINFKNCLFNNCQFSLQALQNCNFNDSIFIKTNFFNCEMDKATSSSLPEEISEEFVDHADKIKLKKFYCTTIHTDSIPHQYLINSAEQWLQWISTFSNIDIEDLPLELYFMAASVREEEDFSKYIFNIQKSLNKQYDTIMMPVTNGFYYFESTYNSIEHKSWKLHISVDKPKVKQAFNCIAPILLNNDDICHFKIIDLSIDERLRGERLSHGAQFTVYLHQNKHKPLASEERLKTMLQKITEQLQLADVMPGQIPKSDRNTISPYISLRNDGEQVFEYYPAKDSGCNYNPYNVPCIFDYLLLEENKTFNLEEHYTSFNLNTDKQVNNAVIATMVALLNSTLKPEQIYVKDRHKINILNYLEDFTSFMCKFNISESTIFNALTVIEKKGIISFLEFDSQRVGFLDRQPCDYQVNKSKQIQTFVRKHFSKVSGNDNACNTHLTVLQK